MASKAAYDRRAAAGRLRLALSRVLWAELEARDRTIPWLARESGLPVQTVRDLLAGATEPRLSAALAVEAVLWPRRPGELSRRVAGAADENARRA